MYFFAIGASFCQNVLSLQLCYQLDILQRKIFKTEAIVVYTNREDKKVKFIHHHGNYRDTCYCVNDFDIRNSRKGVVKKKFQETKKR